MEGSTSRDIELAERSIDQSNFAASDRENNAQETNTALISAEAAAAGHRAAVALWELLMALSVLVFFSLRLIGARIGRCAWVYINRTEAHLVDSAALYDLESGARTEVPPSPIDDVSMASLEKDSENVDLLVAACSNGPPVPTDDVNMSLLTKESKSVDSVVASHLYQMGAEACANERGAAAELVVTSPLAAAIPKIVPWEEKASLPIHDLAPSEAVIPVPEIAKEHKTGSGSHVKAARLPFQDITNFHASGASSYKYAPATKKAAVAAVERFDLATEHGEPAFGFPKQRLLRPAAVATRLDSRLSERGSSAEAAARRNFVPPKQGTTRRRASLQSNETPVSTRSCTSPRRYSPLRTAHGGVVEQQRRWRF